MRTTILAEYRYGNKTSILERFEGELETGYRITTARRFNSLAYAKDAFLADIPQSAKERMKQAIAEHMR